MSRPNTINQCAGKGSQLLLIKIFLLLCSLPSYYKELKKYHLQHHFSDYQKGFGVTSKFWDKVFGTELIYTGTPPKKLD